MAAYRAIVKLKKEHMLVKLVTLTGLTWDRFFELFEVLSMGAEAMLTRQSATATVPTTRTWRNWQTRSP